MGKSDKQNKPAIKPKRKSTYKICEHNDKKYKCRICTPHYYCIHDIGKYNCLKCNVKVVCKHRRNKYKCKTCKPTLRCFHKKLRRDCDKCKSKCEHNKYKGKCSICIKLDITRRIEWDKTKNRDKQNKNIQQKEIIKIEQPKSLANYNQDIISILCEHNNKKYKCIVCNPSLICLHGNNKYYCLEC